MKTHLFTLLILLNLSSTPLLSQRSVTNTNNSTVSLDTASGSFRILFTHPSWHFTGRINGEISHLKKISGRDIIGPFRELTFDFTQVAKCKCSIKEYDRIPIILFSTTFTKALDSLPPSFPTFTGIPDQLGMLTFSEREFGAPPVFEQAPGARGDHSGPLLLFDTNANACILSPASDFMVADIVTGDSTIRCGLNPGIKKIPAGYSFRVIMAVTKGINRTWDVWGDALTSLYQKKRPPNDADVGLKYLSYWTDNGATYYYHYNPDLGYAGTLHALKRHYDSLHIPIRSLQLDSWWYAKGYDNPDGSAAAEKRRIPDLPASPWNRFGGLLQYEPPRDLFPNGIRGFHDSIGLPLITHNRWISRESPYRQDYEISGIGAVDPRWWNKILNTISSWGVRVYEQDWLDRIYKFSPDFSTTPATGEAFMDNMARACSSTGLTMQYCMALPRHYLQGGAKYSNLTSIRVSGDRFGKNRWKEFLYASRMANAFGIWPWCDVFMSSETPNILLATLSAGMVGIGDTIGSENLRNIFMAVRPDGVIVKPDEPIIPADVSYNLDLEKTGLRIASTFTDHGRGLKTTYLFADADSDSHTEIIQNADQIGVKRTSFLYDYISGTGIVIGGGQRIRILSASEPWSYHVIAPMTKGGIAFIGDPGKFATCGKQRIAKLGETPHGIQGTLVFAAGEDTVSLCCYSKQDVKIASDRAIVVNKTFDSSTGIVRFSIVPVKPLRYHRIGTDRIAGIPFSIELH